MRHDLEVIVKAFPLDQESLHVYAIGDVHVGSPEFNEDAIRKKLKIIQEDPYGVICLCGDLGDYGLKNSKTNVYNATMQPLEQQKYIYDLFEPVKDRIVSAVPGNHEERITREAGLCPLYDLCVLWGIPDVYRENVAILKVLFGSRTGNQQQNAFCGITTHGSSVRKHQRFIACFDGIDFAISGHTHTPAYTPHGKIRVNSQSATASHVPYKELVVDANLQPGGYGLKKEYEIPAPPELQYLELRTMRDKRRIVHKVINYHAIQI